MRPLKFSALSNGIIALTGIIGVAAAIAYYLGSVQDISFTHIALIEIIYLGTILFVGTYLARFL